MEPTKPRRRWLRISLGGLLLVITMLCLLLGWQADRVARQRRAVEMVERLVGGVTYDYWNVRFDSRAELVDQNRLHELLGRDWFFTATSVSMGPSVSGSKLTDSGAVGGQSETEFLRIRNLMAAYMQWTIAPTRLKNMPEYTSPTTRMPHSNVPSDHWSGRRRYA